jgi:hypothetical protein
LRTRAGARSARNARLTGQQQAPESETPPRTLRRQSRPSMRFRRHAGFLARPRRRATTDSLLASADHQPGRLNRGRRTRASGETLFVSANPVLTERLVASRRQSICSILSFSDAGTTMRHLCQLALVAMVVLFPAGVLAQLVKCRLPNGTLYVGSAPPSDCGPVSDVRERGPVHSSGASGQSQRRPTPTPPRGDNSVPDGTAAMPERSKGQ